MTSLGGEFEGKYAKRILGTSGTKERSTIPNIQNVILATVTHLSGRLETA